MIKIKATIKRIKFYNPDNGYSIFQVHNKEFNTFILTGTAYELEENEFIECSGDWSINGKYGKQFKGTEIRISQPDTIDGIRQYLCSGILPGIGPSSAEKIVTYFKDKVFDILDNNPSRLLDVPGIGRKTLNKIVETWQEKRVSPNIIKELTEYGLEFSHALKLYKMFGEDSVKHIKSSPYELLKALPSLSFEDIDRIALKHGHSKEDGVRILMGILHVFKNEEDGSGNCAIDYNQLLTKSRKLLRVENYLIEKVLDLGLNAQYFDKHIISDVEYWQSFKISKIENDVAYFLKQLCTSKAYYNKDNEAEIDSKIAKEEKKTFPLNEHQREAVKKSLMNKVNIINGGPGVGKTTVLKQLINIARRDGYSVLLCAPTGRAAQRMSESTQMPAFTIHRALEYNPLEGGFIKNINNQLEYDFIVIDEFSMVDIYLIHSLLAATNKNSHVVFIGDTNQLSSIGPGCVLKDLIDSGCISVSKVSIIYRQAAESKIIVNAHLINEGKMVETEVEKGKKSDFYFISTTSDESTIDKIRDLVKERIKTAFGIDPKSGIQLLTPMHDETLGTKNLNIEIQSILNNSNCEGIKKGPFVFKTNDNIMQIRNNYEKMVFNGDVGLIDRVSKDGVLAVFAEQEVFYTKKEMEEITLSYAITIHKSQGSEYPAVVIPVSHKFSSMLDRSLLYTAVTRGKSLVIIVGSKNLFEKALQNEISRKRNTCLKEKIFHTFNS
jgi:exodeoxyribonuclease V alpha subunit